MSAGADVNLQRNDGAFPLSVASVEGHIDIVKLLVHCGAELEASDSEGRTSLWWASNGGQVEVVRFLIEQRADVNACNSSGQSCLLAAVFGGHTDVVRVLVSAGADVNVQCNDGAFPLGVASEKGHVDTVITLLDYNAHTETRDHNGWTAIYSAARWGYTDVVDVLVARGADVNAVDYSLWSSVCSAAVVGHTDVVNTLIQHNAIIRFEDGDFEDPLSWVSFLPEHKVEAMLRLLMNNGAYVGSATDCDNNTALIWATCSGRLNVVKMLVEYGADIHVRNVDNDQARDIASYCGHVDIVKFLQDTCGNSTNMLHNLYYSSLSVSCLGLLSCDRIDCLCNTALHVITDLQHMKSLLESGADVEAENVDGLRPIHCAVRTGLVDLMELLIQHGANVDAADAFGNRPLHEAAYHRLDVVQLLVQHGAKLNVQNTDGKTPLHMAVEHELSDITVFLMKKGADVTLTDVWCYTPLHYLTAEQLANDELIREYLNCRQEIFSVANNAGLCSEQLMRILRQHTMTSSKTEVYSHKESLVAKPVCVDCHGNTPLHRAVRVYGHLKTDRDSTDVAKTVEFLVKRGVDINAQNNDGLTPLHVARGQQAIEACLQHADDQSFTIVDKRGRNFWHLLFILRSQNEVKLASNIRSTILASHTSMYSVDDLNRTPLHYACKDRNGSIETGCSRLTEEFIEKFSEENIDNQDIFGRTALHYAAMTNNSKLMELLKANKADDTVQDNFEKTPSQYSDVQFKYAMNVSLLKLQDTSSFIARNFRSILVCVQQCFSDRTRISEKISKSELIRSICDLRDCSGARYVLNTFLKCRFDYADICENMMALKHYDGECADVVTNDNTRVTQLSTVFAEIHSQVDKAMKCLTKQILNKDIRFACEVIPVGSAYEGTKIGCCDEFDYTFVLTDLSRSCDVCYSPESPPGFVLLKASTPAYDEELFNSNGILNTRIVKFKFETLVKQILSSLSFCNEAGFEFIDRVQDFHFSHRTTSTKLNTHVVLAFTKPVNGCHVPHYVSIDIVPALRIDSWWPSDTRREELCQSGDCLIVFTQPQIKYPWIGWTEPHGFISFARAESRLLHDSPAVTKAAYMVVKRMSKYFCQYEFFSSHVIKTALFWCLDEDRPNSDCTSSDANDEVSEDELLRWVQKILRRLLCFAAHDYVPSYFLPKCHQPVWLREKHLKQFHTRLYRHGLTYVDLFSLNEQQSRDRLLQRIKAMFVFSHVMYWTVLSDNDELKLFVPSTINPLTEDDVSRNLLLVN